MIFAAPWFSLGVAVVFGSAVSSLLWYLGYVVGFFLVCFDCLDMCYKTMPAQDIEMGKVHGTVKKRQPFDVNM